MNTSNFELTDTLIITKTYETKEDWCKHIHNYVEETGCSYMDAIIYYCDLNDIDLDHTSKLVDDNIKNLVRIEAEQNNLMTPIARLDFE